MVKSSLKGPSIAAFSIPQMGSEKVLPCALIYGTNASGKSNFIRSFTFFQSAILESHRKGKPDGGVPRTPFRLSDDRSKPSTFEADFVADNVRYTFGFSCDDENFLEEWLHSFPEGKKRILYERSGKSVEFGSKFLGPKKQLVDFMRGNSLFISTATQNDHPELTKLANFFRSVDMVNEISVPDFMILNAFSKDDEIDGRVISFLDFVGTGVIDYRTEKHEVPDEIKAFSRDFFSMAKKRFGDDVDIPDMSDQTQRTIELAHRGEGGKNFFLDLDRESSGTRRLLYLMSRVFSALDNGSVLFVDELDASLHSLAAEEVVRLFLNSETNPKGAQLIATTHDTNLLGCVELRRDQIWFCERSKEGGSDLYSLAEISSRPNDNFEKGYLEGRYGAIPYAGDLKLLFGRR